MPTYLIPPANYPLVRAVVYLLCNDFSLYDFLPAGKDEETTKRHRLLNLEFNEPEVWTPQALHTEPIGAKRLPRVWAAPSGQPTPGAKGSVSAGPCVCQAARFSLIHSVRLVTGIERLALKVSSFGQATPRPWAKTARYFRVMLSGSLAS